MLSGRIGNEETCPARATDAFQGFSQREVSYLLTYTCGRSGQAKEAHAADQSELITLILALVPPQGQCRVYIVNTTDYPGCPDSDDRLRHIVEGVYCQDGRGGLVERIAEGLEAIGMGDALNRMYKQELAKLA